METVLSVVAGGVFAAGIYLVLRRSAVKLIVGLMLLGHAVNLVVFTAGRLTRGVPPIVPPGADALVPPHADPVPQALVLTAIVIGFGVQAFAIVLLKRTFQVAATDDLDRLDTTERDP